MRVSAVIFTFAVFFFALGGAAIVVGVHDASLTQASFGVTAGSVVLIVVGIVVLVAAFQLFALALLDSSRRGVRPRSSLLVVVAFLLTTVIGVYVFFAALRVVSAQRPVVVVVALLFIFVSLLGLRFFGAGGRVTLPRLGAAVVLGLVGTTIGAWEFWYQNRYAPAHAGRAVALKVVLHREGVQGTDDLIRATVGYEDIGGRSVTVVGSVYTLTGSRTVRCHLSAATAVVGSFFAGVFADPQRARYMANEWEERPATLLAAGKFVGDGRRLDANIPAARDLVFLVPRHRYQLLRLRAELFAIPASVPLSQRTSPEFVKFAGDNDLYGIWHVDDDSWLHDLVSGRERWVVLRYELVDPARKTATVTSPDLLVEARFTKPTWGQAEPSEASVEHLFGAIVRPGQSPLGSQLPQSQPADTSEPFADTEMALEAAPEPDLRDRNLVPQSCRIHR